MQIWPLTIFVFPAPGYLLVLALSSQLHVVYMFCCSALEHLGFHLLKEKKMFKFVSNNN